ncbi:MAG: BACON domain-containing protein [Muribaculaceae bacterium]|nr:BACON domain-containing protein [Muribaculaceae bacterium]
MKLKYFIPLFALLGMLTGCSDDDATYLDAIQVSKSYVTIDLNGGSTEITVTAKDNWEFERVIKKTGKDADGNTVTTMEQLPEWLTVSQTSGQAGTTKLTFSADAALDGRSTELRISCAGESQIINVMQGLPVVEPATCADVIAGPEGKSYRVTGTVKSIANTLYGNWYLVDETGEIYIYGTLDAKGNEKNFLSLGLEVGDIVTVEGPKSVYNGTVELVNVTVVNIQKSLVKVESVEPENATLPKEGGEYIVNLTCKGQGVSVELDEETQEWLSVTSITGSQDVAVKLRARANDKGLRSTTVVFKTTDAAGKEYTAQTTLTQEGSIMDVTIAEFLEAPVSAALYRITGVVTKIDNATDGIFYVRDWSGEAYVYKVNDFAASGVKAGDVVTLVGQRAEYKGTKEMVSATIENTIVVTPISIADFLTLPDSDEDFYMVSGMIDEIANATYGNVYLADGDDLLYVYGCYPGWGATGDNRKGLIESLGLEVGDGLTVIGTKTTYNGVIELKNGIYFSHTK